MMKGEEKHSHTGEKEEEEEEGIVVGRTEGKR
jgi:hypothetical protein